MKRLAYALLLLAIAAGAGVLIVRALLASDLVRSALERQLSERLGQPVHIGEARAAVVPRIALDLRRVSVGEPAVAELGTVRIVTGLRGLLSRRVVGAEIVVADSRLSLPLLLGLLAVPRLAPAEPAPDREFTVESIGALLLRNVTVVEEDRELTVDLDSSIEGDRMHVSTLTVRSGTTRLEASGEVSSLERLQGRFDARAEPLDVAEMIALGSALSVPHSAGAPRQDARAPGPDGSLHLVVALTVPAARFSIYEVRDLSTTIDVARGRMAMAPLEFAIAGGAASGRLEVETSGAAPAMRLSGRMAGMAIEELMGRDGAPGGITGRLGGDLSLTGSGADPEALLEGARGTIRAGVTDGTVPGMDMVRAIVLAFGRADGAPPEGSGSAFSRLGGTFALVDGALRTDDLAMESRDFDLAGHLTLHLVSRALDATVDVVLSRELTAQAGTDLRRYAQEDGRVVIPARVTGTLDRAIVSLDIGAVVKRAIGSELRRRTRSLLDELFRRPGEPER